MSLSTLGEKGGLYGASAPAWAAGLGPVFSGLGSIASGLGFGSKKKKPPSRQALRKDARLDTIADISARVEAAKRAGLHPLSVLGIQPSGSMTSVTGGDSFDPASIGQGIDRALNAGRNSIDRKIQEQQLEKLKAETDYVKSQTAGSVKAIMDTGAVPSMDSSLSRASGAGQGITDYLKHRKINRVGLEDGIAPKHKVMVDRGGNPIRVLNTEQVGDNEILMLADALTATFPDMARGLIASLYRGSKKKLQKISKKKLYRSY